MVNQLQQPPQMPQPAVGMQQPQMQGGQSQMPPQQVTPEMVQEDHERLSYMQEMLNDLIKKPDNELNLRSIFDGASDMVLEYQTSGGKRGVSPQTIAAEMSDPDFPTADTPASQIRQFLQKYFDKSVMTQAAITHHFGPPQQPQQPEQPPQQAQEPQ